MTVVFIKMHGEYFLRIESRTTLAYEWVICYDAKVDNCPKIRVSYCGKDMNFKNYCTQQSKFPKIREETFNFA